jgi:hypothetical protein
MGMRRVLGCSSLRPQYSTGYSIASVVILDRNNGYTQALTCFQLHSEYYSSYATGFEPRGATTLVPLACGEPLADGLSGVRDNSRTLAILLLCYVMVMVPLLHTHQHRKQLGVVASCDISQWDWEARSCH